MRAQKCAMYNRDKTDLDSFQGFSSSKLIHFLHFESKVVRAAAKVSLATVYQKHSSLRTRKSMYRG